MRKQPLMNQIKNSLLLFAEKLHFFSYTQDQTYKFICKVSVKNISEKPQKSTLVFPVALDTQKEQSVAWIGFKPNITNYFIEQKFHNSYLLYPIDLQPGEEFQVEESFQVSVLPCRPKLSQDFTFDDYKLTPEQKKQFFSSNKYLQFEHPEIQKLAKEMKGSEQNVMKVARKINDFVIDYLEYKNPILGLYSALEALEKKEVDCGGYDTLFVALCLAVGIPARVVSGFWADPMLGLQPSKDVMHAWAEFMLPNGEWISVDPSIEYLFAKRRTNKSGRFGFVGSDRVVFSKGCDLSLNINDQTYSTDILQNAFLAPQSDDLMVEVFCEVKNLVILQPAENLQKND